MFPRKVISLLLIIAGVSRIAFAQNAPVTHSLFLVGDAGEPLVSEAPIGNVLRQQVSAYSPKATVLFLGDNVYPSGLADLTSKTRVTGEKVLQTQVDWVRGLGVNGVFIPGNHDWARWGKSGLQRINGQQAWLDSLHDAIITLLPRDGCPGPVELISTDEFVVVIIDTQWLLHQYDKPGEEGSCDAKTPADVLTQLEDIFQKNKGKRMIVAAHHPLISYGDHGGVFTWKSHLFPLTDINPNLYVPLPGVGSIYPLYRKFFGSIQDISHPLYQEFAVPLGKLLEAYPGSVFVSGHEHALEYIVKNQTHYVVSGSGSKFSDVKHKKYAKFVKGATGFTRADIHSNGAVDLHFFEVDKEFPQGKEVYETTIQPVAENAKAKPNSGQADGQTQTVRASSQYDAHKVKRFFLGDNYRHEWSEPVEVPILDIGKDRGGLKILQKGGGQQTLSLRMEDSTGHEYVIRSVEKFPEKAVPEMLKKTFAQDLVQDQISASHPFAALVVPGLAEGAGIYHTNPKLMLVPNDPRFGIYQETFANTLVMFEERPAGNWSESSNFGNSKKIVNTSKVLEKLAEDNDNSVDQQFVLRSRLFDMIIGDWDRHDDQWRWATIESKKAQTFRPIPRDRDQAFFLNEGFLSKLWSRKWALPKFEGFDEKVRWPSGLAFNARYFDRSFLTELSRDDWQKTAQDLKTSLTDEEIENAIHQWPENIYKLHGERIIRHLKSRRDKIEEYALDHYEFLAKAVDVTGSNKREHFEVERKPSGETEVKVYKITKEGEKGKKLYERTFSKGETREIRLYGLGDEDIFSFKGNGGGSIPVRVIGGDGKDVVKNEGSRKIFYYDTKDNAQGRIRGVKDRTSTDPNVNEYNRKAFQYDRLAPLIIGNYNPDDGLFIGGGVAAITHGFRKSPFKQRHILLGSIAPLTQSFNFQYQGDFTDVLGKWDLRLDANVKAPNYVNNFFGMGNESVYDDDIEDAPGIDVDESIHYYRYRFEEIKFEPSLVRNLGGQSYFKIGPSIQRIEMEETDQDRYINAYAAQEDPNLFNEYRSFGGVQYQLLIDKRDSRQFTKRGVTFSLEGRNMSGIQRSSSDFSSYEGSLSLIHSFRSAGRLVFAVRTGGGFNTGNFEFYQSQILSGRTELRGFRKTRFYGDSKFYSNFEVRLRLKSFRSYLFPASIGILAFHDLGRVWYKDENGIDPSASNGKSNLWHKGIGGGIWFTPFNLAVLSAEVGHSKEGSLGYVRLGFLF